MEIKITGTPKEIADLVNALQSQPVVNSNITLDGKEIATTVQPFEKNTDWIYELAEKLTHLLSTNYDKGVELPS